MRSGTIRLSSLDCWLGKLAEYIEIVERSIEMRIPGIPHDSLVPWTEQFIEAQGIPDIVRMADLLEYELLPRIRQWGTNPQSMVFIEHCSSEKNSTSGSQVKASLDR